MKTLLNVLVAVWLFFMIILTVIVSIRMFCAGEFFASPLDMLFKLGWIG
jgi:hypothetical protein